MITYPRLFSPLRIRDVELKNRITSSGHDTVLEEHGKVSDALVAYHEARARGGVGLIVVQVAAVHETARYTESVLMATTDEVIPGFARLASATHRHGTKVFGQLFHPGREVLGTADGTMAVAVAPSCVPNERFAVMPRALESHETEEIISGYAHAALRLIQAGLDGVEVVASHGYLPAQFLSSSSNVRNDEWGGSFENRLRFLDRVLEGVRAVVPRAVLGLRMSLGDHDPSGLDVKDALEALRALDAASRFDYVSVTAGTSATLAGSGHIVPDMGYANGYLTPLSRLVHDLVQVPVMVAGRFNQPQEAERALASGDADVIIMTRALISDPEMPNLARTGRSEDIRACVGCNQACIGHFHKGVAISCIQHPETGRELLYPKRRSTSVRRVLVVGAGPAGLKAAAVAAARGHIVEVHEKSSMVGGQVLLAQRLPGREEFGGVATNLERELRATSATLFLHSEVTLDSAKAFSPEVILLATGSRPYRPPLEILGAPCVLDAWQVLAGAALAPGPVVVADWRADWIGAGIALLLRQLGRDVTLAQPTPTPGTALDQYLRDRQLLELRQAGVTVLSLVRLFGVDDDTVYLQHVLTDEPVMISCAALVLCLGQVPETTLSGTLAPLAPVVAIGDALAPRTVEEAVLDALRVASEI